MKSILFKSEMTTAILAEDPDYQKTMTRRPLKPQIPEGWEMGTSSSPGTSTLLCVVGIPDAVVATGRCPAGRKNADVPSGQEACWPPAGKPVTRCLPDHRQHIAIGSIHANQHPTPPHCY